MFITELKNIEILCRNIYYGHDLKNQINNEDENFDDFKKSVINLFNLQSIQVIIASYVENPSFNMEEFLFYGTIPNKYPEKISHPNLDPYFINEPSRFYRELIKALIEGNYTFTERGNIIVSNELIESEIPSEWLYRLAQTYKNERFQKTFIYNKNKENDITDENSLINYLHHTKLFACTLTSQVPNINFNKVFTKAQNQTTTAINKKSEVKVSNIAELFQSKINPKVNCDVSKLKLDFSLITMIVKQANSLGIKFYNQTLKEQKKYIDKWLIEYLNSNINANEITQIYLLKLLQSKNEYSKEEKNKILISLLNTYLIILKNTLQDFTNITLSDFKIITYMNPNLQNYHLALKNIIKKINSESDAKQAAKTITEIEKTIQQIKQLDDERDKELIQIKNEELSNLFDRHSLEDTLKQDLLSKRNTLQNLIHYEQENSLQEIAFDNDYIISLLINSIYNGEVYINPLDKDEIIFEITNPRLSKNIFQAKISIKKALNFMTINNALLDNHKIDFI